MTHNNIRQPALADLRRKLLISLALNGLLPLIAYTLLRLAGVGDFLALALAAGIPAARTLVLWIWRRRLDWLGIQALLGFGLAAGGSVFLSGNPLLLEVHSSLLTGTLGLVLLFSVAMGKPLLQSLAQAFVGDDPRLATQMAGDLERRKRLSLATLIAGVALLADTVAHVVLALTTPVAVFLGLSRVMNWVILGAGAAGVWWLRRRAQTAPATDGD